MQTMACNKMAGTIWTVAAPYQCLTWPTLDLVQLWQTDPFPSLCNIVLLPTIDCIPLANSRVDLFTIITMSRNPKHDNIPEEYISPWFSCAFALACSENGSLTVILASSFSFYRMERKRSRRLLSHVSGPERDLAMMEGMLKTLTRHVQLLRLLDQEGRPHYWESRRRAPEDAPACHDGGIQG